MLARRVCLCLGLTLALLAAPPAVLAVDASAVPAKKHTRAGLYLTASEVTDFIRAQGGAARVLFLDVRSGAEALFVGLPTAVDALVPLVEAKTGLADWDAKAGSFKFEPLPDFEARVRARLQAKGLKADAPVILICRSGERSARAADRLSAAGFTRVLSVVDGFEGDAGPDGRRSVNGWKNSGQPWGYQLKPGQIALDIEAVKP